MWPLQFHVELVDVRPVRELLLQWIAYSVRTDMFSSAQEFGSTWLQQLSESLVYKYRRSYSSWTGASNHNLVQKGPRSCIELRRAATTAVISRSVSYRITQRLYSYRLQKQRDSEGRTCLADCRVLARADNLNMIFVERLLRLMAAQLLPNPVE